MPAVGARPMNGDRHVRHNGARAVFCSYLMSAASPSPSRGVCVIQTVHLPVPFLYLTRSAAQDQPQNEKGDGVLVNGHTVSDVLGGRFTMVTYDRIAFSVAGSGKLA